MDLRVLSARSFLDSAVPISFSLRRQPQLRRSMGQGNSRVMTSSSPTASAEKASEVRAVPSKEELRKRLTSEQYYVTQQKGTERAFTGPYWNEKKSGVYHCICCDTPLFESSTKFDSGTGWPSYWDKIGSNVREESDWSIPFMPRTEVLCASCGGHLGHVFKDGPRPTGLRYCINSASLRLQPEQAS